MDLSPLLSTILNVIRVPLGYFFPFFAVWMLIRRLEKGLAEHIASWYFYVACASIVIETIMTTLPIVGAIPVYIAAIGEIIACVCMFLLYFFILRVKCYLQNTEMYSQIKNHLGFIIPFLVLLVAWFASPPFDWLKSIPLPLPVICIGLAIIISGLIFVMLSYFELAWFFKRFKCSLWILPVIGGMVGAGILFLDFCLFFQLKSGIPIEEVMYTPSFFRARIVVSIIQGTLGTLPSIYLAIKLLTPFGVRIKEESVYGTALNHIIKNASEILGSSAEIIFTDTVKGFNRRFGKAVKIEKEERGVILSNMEPEQWPHFLEFLLTVFYECVGPITFKFCEGAIGIESIVAKVSGTKP
jgi:hypothetical protein